MGNWNIIIRGVGQHHNGMETDAEKFAERFAQEMRDAGHTIKSATITSGDEDDVTPTEPSQKTYYLNDKERTTPAKSITYEEICELAGHRGRMLTVTYSALTSNATDIKGSLVRGSSVKIYEGMRINAIYTSNA